jgi:hypothetical protein
VAAAKVLSISVVVHPITASSAVVNAAPAAAPAAPAAAIIAAAASRLIPPVMTAVTTTAIVATTVATIPQKEAPAALASSASACLAKFTACPLSIPALSGSLIPLSPSISFLRASSAPAAKYLEAAIAIVIPAARPRKAPVTAP